MNPGTLRGKLTRNKSVQWSVRMEVMGAYLIYSPGIGLKGLRMANNGIEQDGRSLHRDYNTNSSAQYVLRN
jgi:hypothetical protein